MADNQAESEYIAYDPWCIEHDCTSSACRHEHRAEIKPCRGCRIQAGEIEGNAATQCTCAPRKKPLLDGPCEDCGHAYPAWFAVSEMWNAVMSGPGATDDPGGLLCPTCFLVRAEDAGVRPAAWHLSVERDVLRRALHDAWLAVHVGRFDGDYTGRDVPECAEHAVPDSIYNGTLRAERRITEVAARYGIDYHDLRAAEPSSRPAITGDAAAVRP